MSVGCFIGIKSSYTDEAQAFGDAFIAAINSALHENQLLSYSEPLVAPDVYNGNLFGRSALDHHSARCLVEFADQAGAFANVPHLALVAQNPYRVAFLPADFEHPFCTSYSERIFGEEAEIWAGSAPRLMAELMQLAGPLQIPVQDDQLTDEIARKINDFAPLYEGDDCSLSEDERTAWLVLFEGARLAVQHNVALCLAG